MLAGIWSKGARDGKTGKLIFLTIVSAGISYNQPMAIMIQKDGFKNYVKKWLSTSIQLIKRNGGPRMQMQVLV